jgi:hypothetical protein
LNRFPELVVIAGAVVLELLKLGALDVAWLSEPNKAGDCSDWLCCPKVLPLKKLPAADVAAGAIVPELLKLGLFGAVCPKPPKGDEA